MLRILLVVDDYGELLFLQTLLKKLGFDVDGIQNERSFEESFLALNPDVIIATAQGKKVDGIGLAESIRKVRGIPKIVLLAGGPMLDRLQSMVVPSVDGVLESPVSASRLLGVIAQLGGLDPAVLLDKYRKLKATLSPEREADLQILQRDDEGTLDMGQTLSAPLSAEKAATVKKTSSEEARQQRFQNTLKQIEKPKAERFERQRIQQFTKEIRADEDPEDSAELEAERRSFVKEMFKKAKASGRR
ncbi:MAG: hypothetical protein AB7N80_01960 [Bdellovibrionales bacterium]